MILGCKDAEDGLWPSNGDARRFRGRYAGSPEVWRLALRGGAALPLLQLVADPAEPGVVG